MNPLRRTRRGLGIRPDAWLVWLTVAAVLALHRASSVFVALEQRFFDVVSTAHQRQPSEQVVIVAIGGNSVDRIGMVLGTPSFMSPEQLGGQAIDGRSDLYCLGVMLYQLLTGVLPFQGASLTALMFNIANQPPPNVRVLRPEVPVQVADVMHQSMAKAPTDRLHNGPSMALALEAAVALSPTLALLSSVGFESHGSFDKTELLTFPAHAVANNSTVVTQAVTKVGLQSGDGLEFKL